MKSVKVTGKTVKEAVSAALRQLDTSEDKVSVDVIVQPSKGLFGLFGARDAVVEVTIIDKPMETRPAYEMTANIQTDAVTVQPEVDMELNTDSEADFDPIERAKDFLAEMLDKMNIGDVEIVVERSGNDASFDLVGEDLGILIGRRGQTLDSLQYLVNIVANKKRNKYVRIVLDAENYRARREETLQALADRLAAKAIRLKTDVFLEPMTPLERKIIHTQLQDHAKVMTASEGDEPNRRVVIKLKA